MSSQVSISGLEMRFADGTHALGRIDTEIESGKFVSILGPSGCGKSTLLRLVSGLMEPSAGRLTVDRIPPVAARRVRQDLAYVFQDPTLLPWRTVRNNVALPLELGGRDKAATATAVGEVLELVGLAEFADYYPMQLSGGMRMRTSIARALVDRPGLLLLDEPFGALDEITRQRLNEELLRLWEQDRWTGIFVTHNVFEAVYVSQRILVMSSRPGRILDELEVPLAHPRTPEMRSSAEYLNTAAEASRILAEQKS